METINLFGAGGHAKVIMDIIEARGHTTGFLYDDAPHCDIIHGRPVLKADEANVEGPLIISIGSNIVRKIVSKRYPLHYTTAVHPATSVSEYASLGCGTVVMQGAVIQADAVIGRHCIVNTGASVDHECRIGDFVHISPHATLCGNVSVGEGSLIGAGAIVTPGIRIGRWAVIGAGSVVVRDVPDGATAYGNPCRIKYKEHVMPEPEEVQAPSETHLS